MTAGAVRRAAHGLRRRAPWAGYVAVAAVCTWYLNLRTRLVPRWGQWYAADGHLDGHPYVTLQLRAWFSGHLALIPHPAGGDSDYVWGRDGLHTAWGLGLPLLSVPFHAVARLFGATAFPDDLRFLVLFAITAALLTRALHRAWRPEATAFVASAAAAGFLLLFPTYVGLIAARFRIYEQVVAVGALWCMLLLAGLLAVIERPTLPRVAVVCAASAFAIYVRPPLAAYGATTAGLALFVAWRDGRRLRDLALGLSSGVVVVALYLASNAARFGSPFELGYGNLDSGWTVNRLTRWGLDFSRVPLGAALKEAYAWFFLIEPGRSHIAGPPPGVVPFITGERFREFYSPGFDRWVFAAWMAAIVLVAWRLARRPPWRRDREPAADTATLVGVWAAAPSIALFPFYARVPNMATRYLVDLYPAYAVAMLFVALVLVEAVRRRSPSHAPAAQMALVALAGLYASSWHGWPSQLSQPMDAAELRAALASVDARSTRQPPAPSHARCGERRGPSPVYAQFQGWDSSCFLHSGTVFAFADSPCVAFTFGPVDAKWGGAEDRSLAGFRARADFDALKACGAARVEGQERRLTMCEPHPPRFVLDGMRLYAVASLDERLDVIDHMKLRSVDAVPACPR